MGLPLTSAVWLEALAEAQQAAPSLDGSSMGGDGGAASKGHALQGTAGMQGELEGERRKSLSRPQQALSCICHVWL